MDRYGIVTGLSPERGFGFITEDQTNYSIFFHVKDVAVVGNARQIKLDQLFPMGTPVVFTVENTEKGLRGISVRAR
jgi:cold shock CspA family protein